VSQRLTAPLVAVALFVACAIAAIPSSALAAQHSYAPVSASPQALVFTVNGVSPRAVRSAHLRLGSKMRRLQVSRVRRDLADRRLRLSISRQSRSRSPRLILRTRPVSSKAAPSTSNGPVYHLSPAGSDSGSGSADAPWLTLDHAVRVAGPGSTVVLAAGTYGRPGTITRLDRDGASDNPITFTGPAGGERPRILGHLRLDGDYVHVRRVLVDGPTGRVAATNGDNPAGEDVGVWMRGNGTLLADSEVRDSLWHAGIFVSNGQDVSIENNYIHDNGNFSEPAQSNLDHGIYWSSGSGRVIGNRIEHNVAYGVQLYPEADNVLVQDNHISGHARGGLIIAEQAANNLIVGNSITANREGIKTYALTGTGNVARDNRVWANSEANYGNTSGLALR
jgi:Periplasmic copper-binding protein (NosD)